MKLTLFLVALNVIAFLFSLANFDYYIQNYGFNQKNFLSGNYYIIITSMFLHASFGHLISNMIALFFLGWAIEKNTNAWQYIIAYFSSGAVSNLSVMLPIFGYTSETIAIGASAAISGLVGLGAFICPGKFVLFPTALPLPFIVAGAIYLLVNLSNLFVPSQVAYSAHIIGMLTGALFGLIWGEDRKKRLFAFTLLLILIPISPLVIAYFI